ncbi:MAG: hypothetical protein PHS37_07310, partial [Candidatus Omnitrophica bacterium]|nr:hypothetical protein [Candidatus Omnitrophota bacterium]
MKSGFLSSFRYSKMAKVFALLVVQSFVFYNVSFASVNQTPPAPEAAQAAPAKPTIDTIGLSKDIGTIKAKHAGANGKLILHIQDAHCNYEAQTNISKILETFSKDYSINLISVEGADGLVDTSWFKAFPDAEIRREVADYFMKKGEITGAEFLSITKDYPIKLFGAETRDLYIQNLNAFTSTYPMKAEMEKYLQDVRTILNNLKHHIYSKDLKAFDTKVEEYKDKKITLSDYAKYLSVQLKRHNLDLKNYENFAKLVYTLVYEDKIDFEIVNQERTNLIDKLSKDLKEDKLKELVGKSVEFKAGKVSTAEYYMYLQKVAEGQEVDLAKDYPNLANYVIYTRLYEKIDNERLFDELDSIKESVQGLLCANEDQKTLALLWENVNVLLGLINIKLANKEYNYYKAHEKEFAIEYFMNFIKAKINTFQLPYTIEAPTMITAENLKKMQTFYEIAIIRDKALIDNTIKAMGDEKTDVAVLITGGFHTEGMRKLLEEKGIGYMVICPTITKDVESPYIQVLTNQRTPFEDLLVESATPTKKDSLLAPCLISSRILEGRNEATVLQGIAERIANDQNDWVDVYAQHWMVKVLAIANELKLDKTENLVVDSFMSALEQVKKKNGINLTQNNLDTIKNTFRNAVRRHGKVLAPDFASHIAGLDLGTDQFGINVRELLDKSYFRIFADTSTPNLKDGERLVRVINTFKIAYRNALEQLPTPPWTEEMRELYIAKAAMKIIRLRPVSEAIKNNIVAFGVSGGDCGGLNPALAAAALTALNSTAISQLQFITQIADIRDHLVLAMPEGLDALTKKDIWEVGIPVDHVYASRIQERGSITPYSTRASIFKPGKASIDTDLPNIELITAIKNLTGFKGDPVKLQKLLFALVYDVDKRTMTPVKYGTETERRPLPQGLVKQNPKNPYGVTIDLTNAMIYYRNDINEQDNSLDNPALVAIREYILANSDPKDRVKGAIIIGGDDHSVEAYKLSMLLRGITNVNAIFKSVDNDVNALMMGFHTAVWNSRERFVEACVENGVMIMEVMGRKYADLAVRVGRKDLESGSPLLLKYFHRLPERLQNKYHALSDSFATVGPNDYISLKDIIKKVKETYFRTGGRVNMIVAEGYEFWKPVHLDNLTDPAEVALAAELRAANSTNKAIAEAIETKRIEAELAEEGILDNPEVQALLYKRSTDEADAHGHKPLNGITKFIVAAVKEAIKNDIKRFKKPVPVVRNDLGYSPRGDAVPQNAPDGSKSGEFALATKNGAISAELTIVRNESGRVPFFAELKSADGLYQKDHFRNPADPEEDPVPTPVDDVVFGSDKSRTSKLPIAITDVFTEAQLVKMGMLTGSEAAQVTDENLDRLAAEFSPATKAGFSVRLSAELVPHVTGKVVSTLASGLAHKKASFIVVPGGNDSGILAYLVAHANRDYNALRKDTNPVTRYWGYVLDALQDTIVILVPEYQDKLSLADISKVVGAKYAESKHVHKRGIVNVILSRGYRIKANDKSLLEFLKENPRSLAAAYVSHTT